MRRLLTEGRVDVNVTDEVGVFSEQHVLLRSGSDQAQPIPIRPRGWLMVGERGRHDQAGPTLRTHASGLMH